MKNLPETDPKVYPKAPASLRLLKNVKGHGVGESVYDVVTRMPGHKEAWKGLTPAQQWEILYKLKETVSNVHDLKDDEGKVGIASALKFGRDVDLSSLQPFREALGLDKGQFLDSLQNSIVSHVSEKQGAPSLLEVDKAAADIRSKFGLLARMKTFRRGGRFRLLKK